MPTYQSFLVLDSLYATSNIASNNSTFTIDTTKPNKCPHSFNTNWKLISPIQKCTRIYLKSLSLPILFPNIRSSNNSNTLSVQIASTVYTITLPDRTYKDLGTLLNRINYEFTKLNVDITFTQYTDAFLTTFAYTAGQTAPLADVSQCYGNVCVYSATGSVSVLPSILANTILGFNPTADFTTTNPTNIRVAGDVYNLNYDAFLSMVIYTHTNDNIQNVSGNRVSFNIPLNSASGTILYNSENLQYNSYIMNHNGDPIDQIGVVFLDRFGYSVHSRGADWTCVIALEYDS